MDEDSLHKIAKILDQVFLSSLNSSLSSERICQSFDQAELECLNLVVSNTESDRLLVKKAFIKRKLLLFCDREEKYEIVNKLYQDVKKLGFNDVDSETTVEIIYARYLLRKNMIDEANYVCSEFRKRIDSVFPINEKYYCQTISNLDDLESKIAKRNAE